MAFEPKNFSQFHGYGIDADAQVSVFKYNSQADTQATVEASGYFNSVYNQLNVNDLLFLVMESGAATGLYLVAGISATNVVTITGFATIGAGGVGTTQIAASAVTAAKIAAAVAGDGLAGGAGTALSVNVDDTSIEIAADTLGVKALGIDTAELAANAVTTAKLDPSTIQYVAVDLTAAEINGMYAAPVLLKAAGGANTVHRVHHVELEVQWVSAQFASGGALAVQYDSTVNGAGTLASDALAAATLNGYTADSTVGLEGLSASAASSTKVNKGLYLSNLTGAFTTGDSTATVHLWYSTAVTTV